MSQITLKSALWRDLVAAAKKKQRKPDALAAKAIQDYLQRLEDEELLERSTQEAKNGRAADQSTKNEEAAYGVSVRRMLQRRIRSGGATYSSSEVLSHVKSRLRKKS